MVRRRSPSARVALPIFVLPLAFAACSGDPGDDTPENVGVAGDAIVDVEHTAVERQAIGNCWLYAHASWMESMHKASTGEAFDVSETYWTYWHWFDQIVSGGRRTSISTGGTWSTANRIVQRYGLVPEASFIAADTEREMSSAQGAAELRINTELSTGQLADPAVRTDRALVRRVLDGVFGLDRPENAQAKALLDTVFGAAAERSLQGRTAETRALTEGTAVVDPNAFVVRYAVRNTRTGAVTLEDRSFAAAMREWRQISYPSSARARRTFLRSMQTALHARQPVVISWAVDFNALENGQNERRGSFNMATLEAKYAIPSEQGGGPGRQGGHMTVLEDYQVRTTEFGTLAAGVTLDPATPDGAARLAAALRDDSEIEFLRVKNSWGASRWDRAFSPGFPGYHDLYMDYLNGPIQWCSESDDTETDVDRNCSRSSWRSVPMGNIVVPPGFDLSRR